MEAAYVLVLLIILVLLLDPLQVFARTVCTILVTTFWLIVAGALGVVAGIAFTLAVVFVACGAAIEALSNWRKGRRRARWLKTHQVPR